jgi:hypothetical protein
MEAQEISARYAIHAAVMLNHDVEWIASLHGGSTVCRDRRIKPK